MKLTIEFGVIAGQRIAKINDVKLNEAQSKILFRDYLKDMDNGESLTVTFVEAE